jgi:acid phosphatase (class A)
MMRSMSTNLCAGMVAMAFCLPAFSANPVVASSAIDAVDMLPATPKTGGAVQKADLAELHLIQAHRTAAAIAHAQSDAATRNVFLFATIFGPGFNAKALPLTAALSAQVEASEKADIEPIKYIFARVRPYHFDKTLHPVCPATKKDDSYPSGHAMSGYLEALTLASILPEKKDAIFACADDYAHSRLFCGVHYPSDVAASRPLAYALFAILADDPRFKAERDAAQAELRKAFGPQIAAK